MGLFDGKVVAITGAGGGLGKAYALAFAREGAKVVVNDLGGARDGSGAGSAMADQVVAEIQAMGGQAAPNYASVATREGAESIVKTALDAFGRLDVLVNNAGILRDKTLVKMTDDMWDIVIAVHLKGTYLCTQVAAQQMLEQGTPGRIINTSSLAGLKGNFGQTNYGSAKAGIAGLTRVAALELGRKGITVNCIAPIAKTRLTDDVSAIPDEARPELVAPMVLFLASDMAAGINGRIFGVHGNHLFEYHTELTRGVDKGTEPWTPQEIRDRLADIARTEAEYVKKEMAAAGAPAPAAADPATKALKVFEAMATCLRTEKVGGWEANLHFDLGEVGPFTVKVSGGVMTAAKGFEGSPTCLVKMDGDTFFGMTQGKVDGTQAFMQGKITATNLGDLMKYSTAFDQKKARQAVVDALASLEAAAAAAPAAAPAKADPLTKATAVFEAMATAFAPDKVSGWEANLHFDIAEVGLVTLKVGGGAMSVAKGAQGDATCLVKMDADTFFGMTQGKVDGTQAFMAGKITATNLGDLMKYSKAFDQKKARAAVVDALARIEAGPAPAVSAPAAPAKVEAPAEEKPEGLNRACLGMRYALPPVFVKAEETMAYAQATNDNNTAYLDTNRPGGVIAPVLFPVRLFHDLHEACLLDPELNADVTMLLFGEQDMRFFSAIHPTDLLERTAWISHMEKKETGEVFDLTQWLKRDGKLVCETTSRFFIRSRERRKSEPKQEKPEAPATPPFAFTRSMPVRLDQTKDYAAASGDHNPIHLDDNIAKAAGMGGIILHGLCTMAFASQAFVKQVAGEDPTRIRRLKVRFARPVRPGDVVTTQAWLSDQSEAATTYEFRMVNQEGVVVVTKGLAEVASG